MHRRIAIALLLSALPALAEIGSFQNNKGERLEVSMGVYDATSREDFNIIGFLSIGHGQPVWKEEYDEGFDRMTKGHVWRYGMNGFATFDCNVPVKVGGQEIPAGVYYVGIGRTEDDKWTLVFIDPKAAHEKKITPFPNLDKAPRAFEAPITHEKWDGVKAEKLSTRIEKGKTHGTGTLNITWGSHKLSAPLEMICDKK
jgi:hypothetical protein